jgi:hypothetical protein
MKITAKIHPNFSAPDVLLENRMVINGINQIRIKMSQIVNIYPP